MNYNIFHLRSLKTRMTLFTLAIFLIGIWLLTFFASRILREDIQRMVCEQQFSTVSLLADQVNEEIDNRLRSLEIVAKEVTHDMLVNPAALQTHLERCPILQMLFNSGTLITEKDGTTIASVPLSFDRLGVNYMDRDFIAAVLNEGKASVGRPVMGRKLRAPAFGIGVPIRDSQGQVIAALAGVTNLSEPNFTNKITDNRYGKSGGYFLVSMQHRLIVTASDKTRVMEQFPAPGVIPAIDRFLQGNECSAVYVNPLGIEVLGSIKVIPVAGWFMGAILPTKEAFAPIHAMQQSMLIATILLTLLAGGLTCWISWRMLIHQLSPMLAATEMLATMSDTDQSPQPLSVTSQDEIGQLIGGFNCLLENLANREKTLKESEERYRVLFENAKDGIFLLSSDGAIVSLNSAFARMHGYTAETMLLMDIKELEKPENVQLTSARFQQVLEGEHISFETEHYCMNGQLIPVEVSASFVIIGADKYILSFLRDITDRKRAEEEKAELEAQNRQLQKAESLSRMAGAIAHHFNNQLQAVMGNLEMAMDNMAQGIDTSVMLTRAHKAARKAAEVSSLMLTYLGQAYSKYAPVSLSETCSQGLTLLQAAAPNGMTLKAHLPFDPVIFGNTGQIQQILTNLVTNAWESMSGNLGAICLTVKTVSHADIPIIKRFPSDWRPQKIDYACLEVADTGCGISNDDIENIFDPFFTTKFTGRGLGLPVVMGIVKAHGGGVTVESKPDRGSIFRIFLPVSTEEFPCRHDLLTIPEALPAAKAEKFSKMEGGGTVLG